MARPDAGNPAQVTNHIVKSPASDDILVISLCNNIDEE